MNISFFIAKKVFKVQQSAFSTLISRIAVGSVALGITVVLLAFMIFNGFQGNIQDKIFSFAAHLQLSKFTLNQSYEEQPISSEREFLQQIKTVDKNILQGQIFSKKPALMRANEEVLGIVLKGIAQDFDTLRFQKNMISGKLLRPHANIDSSYSQEIVISRFIADKLNLSLQDKVVLYFIQDPPKFRKLTVTGIYKTDIEDFDKRFVLCDNKLIQGVNSWADSLAGGYEIFVKDFQQINHTADLVHEAMDYDMQLAKVTDLYLHFFDWFVILNRNVLIFLSIIIFVACFNVISILLILIMERTNMIGLLKALGATQKQIQLIFIYNGWQILWKGLLLGNGLALLLAFLQDTFKFFTLDASTYYMSSVPIAWNWSLLVGLNIGIACMTALVLWIPVQIITQISPVKAIRFD
jgi:lipoprotein-releasing system permease protein